MLSSKEADMRAAEWHEELPLSASGWELGTVSQFDEGGEGGREEANAGRVESVVVGRARAEEGEGHLFWEQVADGMWQEQRQIKPAQNQQPKTKYNKIQIQKRSKPY